MLKPQATYLVVKPSCAGSRLAILVCLVVIGRMANMSCPFAMGDDRSGEQIYKSMCARCHGSKGEGTDDVPNPLVGTRSVEQLAKFIEKSMPEDDPETCTGADAEKVAAYIFDAFYSPLAQARVKPVRVELSRLTVRQYRNAVADLMGSFRSSGNWDEQRGLRGEYFNGRRIRDRERLLDRIDPEIKFDFGVDAPGPEKFDPRQFSIQWQGSVLAPDTGEYEFIVNTEHAARLWINDLDQPLIDAWVKSGNETEYRASLKLLGGRVYPLKLEFSKAKQGVDDSKDEKEKAKPPVKASISLQWKPPFRPVEVIPQRLLTPQRFPELYVVTTPFPPDDRSVGYERGTSISKEWDQATTDSAIATAGYVADHLRELSGVREDANDRVERLREFSRQFAERAFRRPLSDESKRLYVDQQFEGVSDPSIAVKRVVLLVLKSPRFLYREVGSAQPDAYDVASRMSFGMWDSAPDEALLKAAAEGKLATREQIVQQLERMLPDLRTRSKIREFFSRWLKIEHVTELAKDPAMFPGFDATVAADLRTSLELFVDNVVWSEPSDFRLLLQEESLFLNGRLAGFYGAELPADAPFQKTGAKTDQRAGVLTHPYLLSSFAYTKSSSPIHRGVFLARSVLGRSLRPPPEAFTPLPVELHPELTTRERVTLQTRPEACVQCHGMINPLGFTLENYDAIGRLREKENGKPIDTTGTYLARTGESIQFNGIKQLADFLASSEEVHTAFVQQLFHHQIKQPVLAYGPQALPDLQRAFSSNHYNIRKLMVEMVALSANPK